MFGVKEWLSGQSDDTVERIRKLLSPSQGADYVEFDVQLTRDLVPVVYHDFFVCTTLARVSMAQDTVCTAPSLVQLHSG